MGVDLKWIPICLGAWCLVGLVLGLILGPIIGRVASQYPEVKDENDM